MFFLSLLSTFWVIFNWLLKRVSAVRTSFSRLGNRQRGKVESAELVGLDRSWLYWRPRFLQVLDFHNPLGKVPIVITVWGLSKAITTGDPNYLVSMINLQEATTLVTKWLDWDLNLWPKSNGQSLPFSNPKDLVHIFTLQINTFIPSDKSFHSYTSKCHWEC